MGGVVRIVNTAPEYGFFFFMPFVFVVGTSSSGFMSGGQYATLLTLVYATNIFANLFFGIFGDRFGWRRTVTFFGCIGCAIATPLWYFASLASGSYIVCAALGMIYGALLAGFVPLSALMPSMVERHDKGASLAILNTGAGGAAFVGPFIATALAPFIGYGGVVITYSALYLVSAVLTSFIVSPADPGEEGQMEQDAVATTA